MRIRHLSIIRGFTLLEVILVIVLLGIIGSVGGFLIVQPIEAYSDVVRRQQLVDQGEMALRQIARDVRRALPNSVRVANTADGWALEMINTVDGARYRDDIGTGFLTDNDRLDFSTADSDFNLLGRLNNFSGSPAAVLAGLRLVIYSTAPTNIYADAAANNDPGIITPSDTVITLSENIPASGDMEHHLNMNPAFQFDQQSPGQRVFLVDGPISYTCNQTSGRISRYTNYAYQQNQLTTDAALAGLAGVNTAPLVTQNGICSITYAAGTSQRGGIVTLYINLSDTEGEGVNLVHQIHVVNVP